MYGNDNGCHREATFESRHFVLLKVSPWFAVFVAFTRVIIALGILEFIIELKAKTRSLLAILIKT